MAELFREVEERSLRQYSTALEGLERKFLVVFRWRFFYF